MQVNPFYPVGSTVNLTATTSTGRVALTAYDLVTGSVRIYNSGTQDVFVEFGSSTVNAALATSMPIKAGNTETFALGETVRSPSIVTAPTHVAVITASATSAVYLTSGTGL